jgi:hypothetical protein
MTPGLSAMLRIGKAVTRHPPRGPARQRRAPVVNPRFSKQLRPLVSGQHIFGAKEQPVDTVRLRATCGFPRETFPKRDGRSGCLRAEGEPTRRAADRIAGTSLIGEQTFHDRSLFPDAGDDGFCPVLGRRPGASRGSAPSGLRPGRRLRAGNVGLYRRQLGCPFT